MVKEGAVYSVYMVSMQSTVHFFHLLMIISRSLFFMNLFLTFSTYTQNVYEPYATSYFKGHSLIATFNIIHGLVRIVGYPLLAKTADVTIPLSFSGREKGGLIRPGYSILDDP